MTGRVSSFQSFGTADGPGPRFVIFLQGCSLRCVYCHNPETWDERGGEAFSSEEILARAERLRPYIKKGGITISGGEPLFQPDFTAELLKLFKKGGFHTCLDTAGQGKQERWKTILQNTDLVLLDIKFITEEQYKKHTGGSLCSALDFLESTTEIGVPVVLRQVVAPCLNDSEENAERLFEIAGRHNNVKEVELLPLRKLCLPKYEALGIPFPDFGNANST